MASLAPWLRLWKEVWWLSSPAGEAKHFNLFEMSSKDSLNTLCFYIYLTTFLRKSATSLWSYISFLDCQEKTRWLILLFHYYSELRQQRWDHLQQNSFDVMNNKQLLLLDRYYEFSSVHRYFIQPLLSTRRNLVQPTLTCLNQNVGVCITLNLLLQLMSYPLGRKISKLFANYPFLF